MRHEKGADAVLHCSIYVPLDKAALFQACEDAMLCQAMHVLPTQARPESDEQRQSLAAGMHCIAVVTWTAEAEERPCWPMQVCHKGCPAFQHLLSRWTGPYAYVPPYLSYYMILQDDQQ